MTDSDVTPSKTGTNAYAWFVVIILAFAYAFSYLDRLIITLMVEPIKQDLGISDTQISLLIGISFAIFYTTCALPFAWLADRFNRRNIIISGISIWSGQPPCASLRVSIGSLYKYGRILRILTLNTISS